MAPDPRRPGYHFTSPVGWINDPLAITWHDGRYELFYQLNPDAPVWTPACRWGQATAADLVRWRDPRTALEPGPDETGCWSGSLVVDQGLPVIVYTSVLADSPGHGRIALAHGDADWGGWTPDQAGPVLGAPSAELGLAHLRDPYVWRDGEQWRMVVGAGSTTGQPSVLQWSSRDLRMWRPDGVVAEPSPGQPGPDGTLWECPQLFRLDESWALVVSVWDEEPVDVAYAVGDYDGRRFTPRAWHRLAPGSCYATTVFLDAQGRRCAVSWLRGTGDPDGDWAGALSVPWLLGVEGDRIVVRPHPDVDSLRTGVHVRHGPEALAPDPLVLAVPRAADVVLRASPAGEPLRLILDEVAGPLLIVVADPVAGELRLTVPGGADSVVPLRPEPDGAVELRLLLDAGVVEAFPGGGAVAALRLSPSGAGLRLGLSASGDGARLEDLVVHRMERVFG